MDAANDKITALTDENAANKEQREKENKAYKAMNLELTDSIHACTQALDRLSQLQDAPSASFLQKSMSSVQATKGLSPTQNALLETIKRAENPFSLFARETSSGTKLIVDMIDKLKADFVDEQNQKNTAETNAKNSYEQVTARNNADLSNQKETLARETQNKAAAEAASADASKQRQQDVADRKANDDYLKQVTHNCDTNSSTFESRSKSRENEILAIDQALTILTGSKAQTGTGHLTNAQKVNTFFLQLGSSTKKSEEADTPAEKAIAFLRSRGASIHSRALVQLAEMATANPFEKVIKLISGLINKLEQQAAEEADKNAHCNTEMNKTEADIKQFTGEVSTFTAKRDELDASVKQLAASLAELREDIAMDFQSNSEATSLRTNENAENKKVIGETEEAIEEVGKAISVLQDYYSKAGTSLVQQAPSGEMMDSGFDGEYGGLEGGAGGPVNMLEVLKGQMEGTVNETKAAEAQAAAAEAERVKSYESKRRADLENQRQQEVQKAEDALKLQAAKESLATSQQSLDTSNKIMDQLNLDCKVQGVSFEERDAKRKEEIQSLKEAIKILEASESSS